MGRPLAVGDKVQCRLFNTPEGKFYGESWVGEILDIQVLVRHSDIWYLDGEEEMKYLVTRDGYAQLPGGWIWLKRKEILRRVK